MRKASKILMLVAGIVSILVAIGLFITAIVLLSCTLPDAKEAIIEGLQNGTITTTFQGTIDQKAEYIQALFAALGVIFIIWAILAIVNSVVSFIGRGVQNKPMLIINIVFGFISCVEINLVGAILGLIANSRENQ